MCRISRIVSDEVNDDFIDTDGPELFLLLSIGIYLLFIFFLIRNKKYEDVWFKKPLNRICIACGWVYVNDYDVYTYLVKYNYQLTQLGCILTLIVC